MNSFFTSIFLPPHLWIFDSSIGITPFYFYTAHSRDHLTLSFGFLEWVCLRMTKCPRRDQLMHWNLSSCTATQLSFIVGHHLDLNQIEYRAGSGHEGLGQGRFIGLPRPIYTLHFRIRGTLKNSFRDKHSPKNILASHSLESVCLETWHLMWARTSALYPCGSKPTLAFTAHPTREDSRALARFPSSPSDYPRSCCPTRRCRPMPAPNSRYPSRKLAARPPPLSPGTSAGPRRRTGYSSGLTGTGMRDSGTNRANSSRRPADPYRKSSVG